MQKMIAVGLVLAFEVGSATAQCPVASLHPDGFDEGSAVQDYFGNIVAVSGDLLVVSSPNHDGAELDDVGAVYVFRSVNGVWATMPESVIEVPSLDQGDMVGICDVANDAVTGDFDVVAVSTGSADVTAGNAWIYKHDPMNELWDPFDADGIRPAEVVAGDFFGGGVEGSRAVAFDASDAGDTLIVGAYGTEVSGDSRAGKAYIFDRDTPQADDWGLVASIDAGSFAVEGARFGWAVAVDDGLAVVGAPMPPDPQLQFEAGSGEAYVFDRDATPPWRRVAVIPSPGSNSSHFGWSVDIDGDLIIVGAPMLADTIADPDV